jgi:hypothetical protein
VDDVIAAVNWLPIPRVAEHLSLTVSQVRRLIDDHHLIATRRDGVLVVPDAFLAGGTALSDLRGTVIVLKDAGFSNEESLEWLMSRDESLEATPIAALRSGRKAEVRRVAQALA